MNEEWRTVPDWELYEISNLGRLRSKERVVSNHGGTYVRAARLLHPRKDKNGYFVAVLTQDGKKKQVKIHRLVAQCFIPNPDNKPCVNHIDNNPSNSRVDNLEWCTMQENTDWMIKQGRFKRTPKWLDNLHESQKETYKAVKGTNVTTGENIYFEKLNAVRDAGFQPSCVCVCCKKRSGVRQHLGYYWEYISKEEYYNSIKEGISQIKPSRSRYFRTRKIQNIDTGVIFDSVKSAASAYGFQASGLARAVKNCWSIGGYKWKYISERNNMQMMETQSHKKDNSS